MANQNQQSPETPEPPKLPSGNDEPRQAAAPGKPAAEPAGDAAVELARVRGERDQLHDRLLRTTAEFDNWRKRAGTKAENAELQLRIDVLSKVLPIADNLERALEHAADQDPVAIGVRLVGRLLTGMLEEQGVTRFSPVGQRFDPSRHEAIDQEETTEVPPGMVVSVRAPGYMIKDRLLRAAMVVVSKRPESKRPESKPESQPPDSKPPKSKPTLH